MNTIFYLIFCFHIPRIDYNFGILFFWLLLIWVKSMLLCNLIKALFELQSVLFGHYFENYGKQF